MEFFKHLPEEPQALADLIQIRPGRVVSMSLTRSECCQMMIMAVSQGEEVTSEEYPGDTLYYVLEGVMPLYRGQERRDLTAGQIAVVPRGVPHAIGGAGDFKLLQMILTQ